LFCPLKDIRQREGDWTANGHKKGEGLGRGRKKREKKKKMEARIWISRGRGVNGTDTKAKEIALTEKKITLLCSESLLTSRGNAGKKKKENRTVAVTPYQEGRKV